MPDAAALLARLRSSGRTVRCQGDKIMVGPPELDDVTKCAVVEHRMELLAMLEEEAAAPAATYWNNRNVRWPSEDALDKWAAELRRR